MERTITLRIEDRTIIELRAAQTEQCALAKKYADALPFLECTDMIKTAESRFRKQLGELRTRVHSLSEGIVAQVIAASAIEIPDEQIKGDSIETNASVPSANDEPDPLPPAASETKIEYPFLVEELRALKSGAAKSEVEKALSDVIAWQEEPRSFELLKDLGQDVPLDKPSDYVGYQLGKAFVAVATTFASKAMGLCALRYLLNQLRAFERDTNSLVDWFEQFLNKVLEHFNNHLGEWKLMYWPEGSQGEPVLLFKDDTYKPLQVRVFAFQPGKDTSVEVYEPGWEPEPAAEPQHPAAAMTALNSGKPFAPDPKPAPAPEGTPVLTPEEVQHNVDVQGFSSTLSTYGEINEDNLTLCCDKIMALKLTAEDVNFAGEQSSSPMAKLFFDITEEFVALEEHNVCDTDTFHQAVTMLRHNSDRARDMEMLWWHPERIGATEPKTEAAAEQPQTETEEAAPKRITDKALLDAVDDFDKFAELVAATTWTDARWEKFLARLSETHAELAEEIRPLVKKYSFYKPKWGTFVVEDLRKAREQGEAAADTEPQTEAAEAETESPATETAETETAPATNHDALMLAQLDTQVKAVYDVPGTVDAAKVANIFSLPTKIGVHPNALAKAEPFENPVLNLIQKMARSCIKLSDTPDEAFRAVCGQAILRLSTEAYAGKTEAECLEQVKAEKGLLPEQFKRKAA